MINGNDDCAGAGVLRPFRILDFSGTDADRPVVRPVTQAEVAQFESATLFESSAWLKAYAMANLLALTAARPNGTTHRLLFAVRDRHLVHLGRLLWFEAACIDYLTDVLLEQSDVDFVVFEDVEVEGPIARRFGGATFRYQRNWKIVLDGPDAAQPSRKPHSTTRRKQRALEKDLGALRIEREERPSRELLATIVAMNRAKIESAHRKYGIDAEELDRLWSVVSELGYAVVMRSGSRVLAGDIICTVGRRAYDVASGYDMKLSRYSPGVIVHRFSIEDSRRRGLLDFNMLWGDGIYKQRLGCIPQELVTAVTRRSPAVRFSPAYVRVIGPYCWHDFKARAKPYLRRRTARQGRD